MSKFNISSYLLSSKDYLSSKQPFREASHACIHSCKLTILSKLGTSEVKIPKAFNPHKDMIYLNILKDAHKKSKDGKTVESTQKELIQSSLSQIQNQIDTKRILSKKVHWVKPIEDLKTEEVSQTIRKLMQEQTDRQKKVHEALEKEKKERLETLEKLKEQEALLRSKKIEEEKLKKISETKEKTEERKKYMEGLKELKNVKKQKWLYEKLAEEFEESVVKPEHDRIAEALAFKHKEPVPTFEDLQQHMKDYKRSKENRSVIRQSVDYLDQKKFPQSKFLKNLMEEEQMVKEMEKIREAEKIDLLDRKKNYANLVRQLYQPSLKDLSITKAKNLINKTPKKRRVLSVTPNLKHFDNHVKIKSPSVQKPRELPKIDYLESRRIIHEKDAEFMLGHGFHQSFDISTVEQAKKAEERVRRVEIAVKGLAPGKVKVDAEEKITQVLIDSIKVKLEALNKS